MAEAKDYLRVGLLAPVESLDPRGAWDMGRALVASQVYETPYAVRGVSLEAEPLLFEEPPVEEVSAASGRQVYSAKLRDGVRFSDGSQLRTGEAAAILGRSQALSGHTRVEARDGRIFFELERPNARFDLALTVLDCAMVRGEGDTLIGTGPYVPEAGGDGVRLVRNPHYRHPIAIPEIRFEIYPPEPDGTPRRLLEAITAGEVDFTSVLTTAQLKTLRGVRRHSVPGNSTALLFFNTDRIPEAAARQAMATAIDRKTLAARLYADPITITNNTANGLLPPMLGGSLDGIMFDLPKAREMLRPHRARLPRSLRLLVIWAPRPYLPQPSRVAGLPPALRAGDRRPLLAARGFQPVPHRPSELRDDGFPGLNSRFENRSRIPLTTPDRSATLAGPRRDRKVQSRAWSVWRPSWGHRQTRSLGTASR